MSTEHVPPSGEPRPLPPARHRVRPAPPAAAPPSAPPAPVQCDIAPGSYKVGYGKPPKSTQFQKGVSGNPRGRPKHAKGFNTIVRERLTEKVEVRTASGTMKITKIEALMLRNIELALKGNVRLAALLAAQYAAAVPEATSPASGPDAEDLTATDLAMLEALRQSLEGLGVAPADEPQMDGELLPEVDPGPPAPASGQAPTGQAKDAPPEDYDWDRRLV